MESASIPARPPRPRGEVVREFISRFGLIALLLVLPVVLRDPGPAGRRRPVAARDQHQGRPVQRRHLGADRRRLHARLRHHRADQLRPRRPVHDRQLRRLRADRRRSASRPRRAALALFFGLLLILLIAMVGCGTLNTMIERVGLPAVAQRAQARAADHGGRLLVHPAERRPAVARRLAPRRAGPDRLPEAARRRSSASRSPTATCSPWS